MSPELRQLITANRGRTLTEAELIQQVRSAAYGDLAIEEPNTSRAAVDAAVDRLFGVA